MLPVYQEYLKELDALHNDIHKAIEGLSPEALDWSPGVEMNSISVLVAHASGSQRFLIGDLVGGIESHRDRNAEFALKGADVAALTAMLKEAMSVTWTTFEKLTLEDANSTQPRSKGGRSFTVAAAIDHALAHVAVHTGHIQMTRQLWDQRK